MITILGPTASGKTALAAHLAAEIGAEIISADSRQVYKGMDIGTGKDLADYEVNGRQVPYHLIDIHEPGYKYNVYQYQQDFIKAYDDIHSRSKEPLMCGGTGMYIEAVLRGYELSYVPENHRLRASLADRSMEELTAMLRELKQQTGTAMHNTTDVDTPQRAIRAIEIEEHNKHLPAGHRRFPKIDSLVVGVAVSRDERRSRISRRLVDRLQGGMIDEVRGLLDTGVSADDLIYYGLEYKYVTRYVLGMISYDDMTRSLEIAIHQFAKRQMTWFRGMERRGLTIHWIDGMLPMRQKIDEIKKLRTGE